MTKALCAVFILLLPCSSAAEFHVWLDENGNKHVSNLPKHCITRYETVNLACMHLIPSGKSIPYNASTAKSAPMAASQTPDNGLMENAADSVKPIKQLQQHRQEASDIIEQP